MADSKDIKSVSFIPKSALVVEDDPVAKDAVVKLLNDMGVGHIETAETSEAGWAALRLHKYDMVLLNWNLSPASGAALLHRIRASAKTQDVPVLVMSDAISKKGFLFTEEYLFTGLLEKPFENAFGTRKIKDLLKDRNWFDTSCTKMEQWISGADDFNANSIAALVKIVDEAPRPMPIGYAVARALIGRKQVESAKAVLSCILAKDNKSALSLTLMGKALLLQKSYEEAKKYLNLAHQVFPRNSERLVLIGDANLNLLDFDAAKEAFKEAAEIDPKNAKAIAGISLAESTDRYFSQVDITKAPDSLASLLNTIGIGLVRSEKFDDGLQYYENALTYLDDQKIKGRVAFNLGLGYLRAQKTQEALDWFHKSDEFCGGHFQKPREYIMKLSNGAALLTSPASGESDIKDDEQDLLSFDSPEIPLAPAKDVELPAKDGDQWGVLEGKEKKDHDVSEEFSEESLEKKPA